MEAVRKAHSERFKLDGWRNVGRATRRHVAERRSSEPKSPASWASKVKLTPPAPSAAAESLQERLEEMAIFELRQDGEIVYHSLTTRGLYKYVLECITAKSLQQQHTVKHSGGDEPNVDAPTPPPGDERLPPLQPRSLPSAQPDNNNNVHETTQKTHWNKRKPGKNKVTYHERLGGYLHPRDMRRLMIPLSASNEPEIIVRRHVILFNFTPVRVIVLRDRMLVLLPDDETEAQWLLDHFVTKIHGGSHQAEFEAEVPEKKAGEIAEGDDELRHSKHLFGKVRLQASQFSRSGSSMGDTTDEVESESFQSGENDSSHALEWVEMNRKDWMLMPFELQATDSILFCVNELLAKDTMELEKTSSSYIDHISHPKNLGDDHFKIMRVIKDGRREMASRVKGFCASMTRTLNEDEDMALMNLTRLLTHPENFVQPVSPEVLENESDEPELILESHLQHGYSLMNTLDLIQGKIESASDLWEQQLDSSRNKILLANMLLTTVSLCLTASSVVGSFLGMNIGVPGEGQDGFFMPVVVGTMSGTTLLGLLILGALFWTGTIQRGSPFEVGDDDDDDDG